MTARAAPRGAMLRALRALADAGDRAAQARWRRAVEGALRAHPTLTAAAEALGMSRRGLTLWVDADASLGALVERRGPGRPRLPQPTAAEATGEWDGDERA